MFARIFRAALKPGRGDAYTRAVEQKVVPILQSFSGFRDEITIISLDGTEALGITLWERQEDVDAYEGAAYADVRKALDPFMTGVPELHKYQVATSTIPEISGGARMTR
jgi:hypothetical protein